MNRSAKTVQAVVRRQIQLRLGRVYLGPEVDVADLQVVLRLAEVGADRQRACDRTLEVNRLGRRRRPIDGVDR